MAHRDRIASEMWADYQEEHFYHVYTLAPDDVSNCINVLSSIEFDYLPPSPVHPATTMLELP